MNFQISQNLCKDWTESAKKLLQKLEEFRRGEWIKPSFSFSLYPSLEYSQNIFGQINHLLKENIIIFSNLNIILKTMCEMLNLGSKPWNNNKICLMCNLGAVENVMRFSSVCPTLTQYRCRYLKKSIVYRRTDMLIR